MSGLRIVKESSILGGHTKNVYEIGPTSTDATGKPYYSRGGSPWATSNVLPRWWASQRRSNAVFPDKREGHGRCAKLTTMLEHYKAIGLINIDVLVARLDISLGRMIEPIKSTRILIPIWRWAFLSTGVRRRCSLTTR